MEHLANVVLEDFEQEFWSGRHNRSRLAAAPLQTLADHLLPQGEPLHPPQPAQQPDAEHQRLHGEAMAVWTQIQHCRSTLDSLIRFLQSEIP